MEKCTNCADGLVGSGADPKALAGNISTCPECSGKGIKEAEQTEE